MNAQTETFEEEYEEYDEFDEEDGEERGLSGLVVLLMGIVMLGAFASVVWIAYQQSIKTAEAGRGETPYVAADPEPVKIENQAAADASDATERSVYDQLDGSASDPVETLAAAPEEPVDRTAEDPIAAIASNEGAADPGAGVVDDAVADRIASLAAADEGLEEAPAAPSQSLHTPPQVTAPTQAAAQDPVAEVETPSIAPAPTQTQTASAGDAMSGTHVVQVGAFGSQNEADTNFSRMQTKFSDLFSGKGSDVERADLDRGTFYRLRVGPFASSAEAKTFCDGLKSRGQDCLVKAK